MGKRDREIENPREEEKGIDGDEMVSTKREKQEVRKF